MEITEVRIKLMEDSDDRLQAFCSITFDDAFVVRDLKIIDGVNGPFVAMPSRKMTSHCQSCGAKNHMRANFCNQCGKRQPGGRSQKEFEPRTRLYADIAHPINSTCREMIQDRVLSEFEAELERAKDPNYTSRYDEEYDDYDDEFFGDDSSESSDRSDRGRLDQEHDAPAKPRSKVDSSSPAKTTGQRPDQENGNQGKGKADSAKGSLQGPHSSVTSKDSASARNRETSKSVAAPENTRDASSRSSASMTPEKPASSDEGGFGAGIFD